MNFNFQDPAILIPVGVILIGLVLFFWAVGKLFKRNPSANEFAGGLPPSGGDDLFTPPSPEPLKPPTDFGTPPLDIRRTPPTREAAPAANREMVDRLDTM